MAWRIRKPSVYSITCPERTRAIQTNRERYWEVWFQKEPNFELTKNKRGERTLVIRSKHTYHYRKPYERTDEYDIWYSPELDRSWKVCIAYNKWSCISERLRRDSELLQPRYGRELGTVVVYYKPSAANYITKQQLTTLTPKER